MRAIVGKDAFTGSWDEDLNNNIGIFYVLSTMCEVDEEERLKSVAVMIKGDVLSTLARNAEGCSTYEEEKHILRRLQ